MWRKLVNLILFGNYFYALCAVALAMESNLQIGVGLNELAFYLTLFCGTVVYYTKAYISETYTNLHNRRNLWYSTHKRFIHASQIILTIITTIGAIYLLVKYLKDIFHIPAWHWFLLLIFPFVAAFYYDISFFRIFRLNLRKTGWLKPFVIGFVWAGGVTVYPVICRLIETKSDHLMGWMEAWFFLKNWMYITVLCIMFDIKDYASDSNKELKTFVVRIGLRRTLFYIIFPLTFLGFLSLLLFLWYNHFPWQKFINVIPFILLTFVGYSLRHRKSIMYYLAIIDGLMLVKALCGILGVVLIK